MTDQSFDTIAPDISVVIRKISEGRVILFLGSGVNKGSKNSKGNDAPIGAELASLVKKRFFPEEDVPTDLQTICALAETRESRVAVYRFLYEELIDYEPSTTVLKQIPLRFWRRIYTTNFDRLLEQAYDDVAEKCQRLRPIYSDTDPQEFELGKDVPYVKLHGCITQISAGRLVLTPEDFVKFTDKRKRLFSRLHNDLMEHTVFFVGYSLSDPNFQSLFYEIQSDMDIRDFPRCYALSPDASNAEIDYWDQKKIVVLRITAAEFFDRLISTPIEPTLARTQTGDNLTELKERVSPKLGLDTAADLFRSFELIDERVGYEQTNKENFFKGDRPSWSAIRTNLDAPRTFHDKIMDDVLLVDEPEKPDPFEVAIITAEAGAGKTTLLMRLAYNHAVLFEGLCLFHRAFREIPISALEELYRIKKKRIFIYMDDGADHVNQLAFLARRAKALRLPITVICAERKNEWNAVKDRLLPIIPIEYELPYLDDQEIDDVLKVLEENNHLHSLATRSIDERRQIFREKANKQLLVAMREATEGKAFDEIIRDEYDNIPSDLGRWTYLNVCSLHRLGVPVRAGLLKRLSGVSFSEFYEKLLAPCERVIIIEKDEALEENLFRARHPSIAEIVCKQVLTDGEKIASTYLEILQKIDLGFASDAHSFRELVRADSIIDAMPGIDHRRHFYDKALVLSDGDDYVYQQYGIMELRHGNLEEAETYISRAVQLEPRNHAYKHSYARLLFQRLRKASNQAQKDRLFREAQSLLSEMMRSWSTNPYGYDSYAQNLMYISDGAAEQQKQEYLKEAHEVLARGIRNCVDRSYLQATDARIFQKLGDYQSARASLLASHRNDPTSIRTALLLGHLLMRERDEETAVGIVNETLRYNQENENLNLLAAKLALRLSPADHDRIIGNLKKAFDPSFIDSETDFLLGVEYFRGERYKESDEIFKGFAQRKSYKMDTESYVVREYILDLDGNRRQFEGKIKFSVGNRGFIGPDILPSDVFFIPSRVGAVSLKVGMRVKFQIGFNLFGPIAQNVHVA